MEVGIITWVKEKYNKNYTLPEFIQAIVEMGCKIEAQVVEEYENTPSQFYQGSGEYVPAKSVPTIVSLVCSHVTEGTISYCRFQLTDEK